MADVKDIYVQIYETLLKETEEGTDEWRDIWCSLIGRLNILLFLFFPVSCMDSVSAVQSSSRFVFEGVEIDGQILKLYGKSQ